MRTAEQILGIVADRGKRNLPINKVYRMLRNRDIFLRAYGKIAPSNGAMTPGINKEDTIDGTSVAKIDRIIEELATGQFQWTPVRRVSIDKKSGGKRRLGVPGFKDKLVQEALRSILSAYYEPQFSEQSHGFRPERGCHTALQEVKRWTGTKWFIEGDIKGCYDNIDHDKLLEIIGRKIKDERLLKLLRDLLKAGYMENWKYHNTYSGVPQGSVIGPLLSNIILNELDEFVEESLIPEYTEGKRRKKNKEYYRIRSQVRRARRKGEDYSEIGVQTRQMHSLDQMDINFRRLKYCRYADDFLLGFIGPKEEAEEIKEKLTEFLKSLKLTLSEDKTLVTHATTQKARFLNYEISVIYNHNQLKPYQRTGSKVKTRYRSLNGTVLLGIPQDVIKKWVRKDSKNGKPMHRNALIRNSDYEIIAQLGTEFRGLVNYYAYAHNNRKLYDVKWALNSTLLKTLAAKHKSSVAKMAKKYKVRENGVTGIRTIIEREGKRPLKAEFGLHQIKYHNDFSYITDEKPSNYIFFGRTELEERLMADTCELCGSSDSVETHHIRKLNDLKRKYQGKKEPAPWVKQMIARNRKTLVVCRKCHHDIHNGKYDGPKVDRR